MMRQMWWWRTLTVTRFIQINLHHTMAASAALLALHPEDGADAAIIKKWFNKRMFVG